jgi:colanic acid/amylovoran biosynthesis protein
VSRLRELWPAAALHVITNAPDRIARHCGDVETVPVRGRRLLLENRLLGRASGWLPHALAAPWSRFERQLAWERPAVASASLTIKAALNGRRGSEVSAYLEAVERADLLVVNGAGIITDAFRENALAILSTLDLVSRRGAPAAMLGQGLGPIHDAELLERAAEVLPRLTLIGVRESQSSVPLLRSLGVPPDRIMVTGDDAIELAYSLRRDSAQVPLSTPPAIGVNVRVAPYAEVRADMLSALGDTLIAAAARKHAKMIPIPIAHHGGGMDVDTLRALLPPEDRVDGGAALDTPQSVIRRIGDCRVVVTGSYHGAVFALAQGIPVVALVKSDYYANKMLGVQQQFGVGCEVVRLDDPALSERVDGAIDRAWAEADEVRAPLLASARDQIGRSRAAYVRLREMVATSRVA